MKAKKLQKRKKELLQDLEKNTESYKETLSQYTKIDNKLSKNLEKMTILYNTPKNEASLLIDEPGLYNGEKIRSSPPLISSIK
jgi:hypothetical protein